MTGRYVYVIYLQSVCYVFSLNKMFEKRQQKTHFPISWEDTSVISKPALVMTNEVQHLYMSVSIGVIDSMLAL